MDRGQKGQKRATLTDDAHGVPLHLVSAGANRHDAPVLAPTPDGVDALRPFPTDITVHLDRGYIGALTLTVLDGLGVAGVIPRKGIPALWRAGKRWVVERAQSWMNGFGKLRCYTERSGQAVDFLFLAPAFVVTRALIQRARTL